MGKSVAERIHVVLDEKSRQNKGLPSSVGFTVYDVDKVVTLKRVNPVSKSGGKAGRPLKYNAQQRAVILEHAKRLGLTKAIEHLRAKRADMRDLSATLVTAVAKEAGLTFTRGR